MPGTHDFWVFLFASFLLWITPGPDTMYILARSIAQGRRAGVLSVLGISSGILLHTLAAAAGLSALLAASAWGFAVVKVAGAVYLIYLGIQALLTRSSSMATTDMKPASGWQVYRQGFVCNVLNPKVAVFFLAFLPQFVDPAAGLGPVPFLLLGASFVTGGTLWCLGVVLAAATATRAFRRNAGLMSWLQRASGCVYIALGLHLLRSRPQPA
jgi:threonine/homoserine/homoserine lactone efflux protein